MGVFEVRETNDLKTWMIAISEEFHQKFPDLMTSSSYGVVAARALGISYPDFLCYCAAHGGKLRGKEGYPVCYFKNKADAEIICKQINKEMEKFYTAYKEASHE